MMVFHIQRKPVIVSLTLTWLLLSAACQPAQNVAKTALHAPAGIAVAGKNRDTFFIANTGDGAIRVLTTPLILNDADFVASQAHYFPLEIQGGAGPTALVASADGLFVWSLDSTTGALAAIDAETLMPVLGANEAPLSLMLNAVSNTPVALAASTMPCATAGSENLCLARVFVAERPLGDVVQVDLIKDSAGNKTISETGRVHLGGAPQALAMHPTEPVLFALDAAASDLLRVDVATVPADPNATPQSASSASVSVERFPLSDRAEAIAITGDGQFVVVSRTSYDDLLVFAAPSGNTASGPLQLVDANPVVTPSPECLSACAQSPERLCGSAHPADQALCVSKTGISTANGNDYRALYLGGVATQLQALSSTMSQQPLRIVCRDDAASLEFDEVIVAAMRDGTLRWVGMTGQGAQAKVTLIDQHFCEAPEVKTSEEGRKILTALLAPCGDMPQGRARSACAPVDTSFPSPQGQAGIGLLRGISQGARMGIAWEGVLPGWDRAVSSGSVDTAGAFRDAAVVFDANVIEEAHAADSNHAAYAGDVLEILAAPRASPDCVAALGLPFEACRLERRIIGVTPDALTLDRPLPAACFFSGAPIPYRIRAADRFLVGTVDLSDNFVSLPVRLGPGDVYGPGRTPGISTPLNFAIRSDLVLPATTDACVRQAGLLPGPGMPDFMNRGQMLSFGVDEPFSPLAATSVSSLAGRLPGGMAFLTAPGRPATLAVSYAASNAVLLLQPYVPGTFGPTNNPNGVLLLH